MADAGTALSFIRLLRDPWRSPDELQALQLSRLRNLIRFAVDHFAFYRGRFDRLDLRPEDIRGHEDLLRIPVVGKELLRQAIREATTIHRNSRWVCTSGSTGMPMRIPFLPRDHSLVNLTWLRPLLAHGIPPRARTLEITGPQNIRLHPAWYQRLGFWRRRSVSILDSEDAWLKALNEDRPDILWGYSGSLKLLAQHIKKSGQTAFRPRWVVGVSDLVDDECRELIREIFHAELLDLYGAAETGCIAWLCSHCGEYHVNIDHLVVEFLPWSAAADPGNPRRIVVTNLYSHAFPIIRYEIGDLGFPSAQSPLCGRGLPLMKVVEGRSDAVVRLPSGRVLSPLFFFAVMKKVAGLARWQVVQEQAGSLTVKVVPDDDGSFSLPLAEKTLRAAVAEPLRIEIEIAAAIPGAETGKVRSVISRLNG